MLQAHLSTSFPLYELFRQNFSKREDFNSLSRLMMKDHGPYFSKMHFLVMHK